MSACGQPHVQTPARPDETVVVLLPDPDSGVVGRVVVSNASGTANLATARASTRVLAGRGASDVTALGDAELQGLIGDVLSALPHAPAHFTLYFQFESDGLTVESRALLPKVMQAVKQFAAPEVVVIGHTDTTGTPAANVELGRKRATMVRALLVDDGLDGALIKVESHGESDLAVRTPDETYEARNRRVEISVR
jgi:outer membrane protein OmpA-like peptidoglycan-associated protein